MWWGIPVLIVAVFVLIAVLLRRRRVSVGETLQILGQVPSGPSMVPLQYLYPGRGEPSDPDVRRTPATQVERREDAELPPGIRRGDRPDVGDL